MSPTLFWAAVTLTLSLALPEWVILTLVVPVLMVLGDLMDLLPPLVRAGGADVYPHDLALAAAMARVGMGLIARRQVVRLYRVHLYLLAYMGVLLAATLFALLQSQPVSLTGYLRLAAQAGVLLALPYSLHTSIDRDRWCRAIRFTGYGLGASVYGSLLLFSAGIRFGELQMNQEGLGRYFGPVGDQIAALIPFFVCLEVLRRNYLASALLAGSVVATGGRMGFVTCAVGLLLLVYQARQHPPEGRERPSLGMPVLIGVGLLVLMLGVGPAGARWLPEHLSWTLSQRVLSMQLALQVFLDHPWTGVGFGGFQSAALAAGARELFAESRVGYASTFTATTGNQYLQAATDAGIPGLLAFGLMVSSWALTLRNTSLHTTGERQHVLAAGHSWLLAMLIANQTAVWLLPGSLVCYLMGLILGFATRELALKEQEA